MQCAMPVRDGRIDGVFGDIALDAQVVVVAVFAGQRPRWLFILSAVCQVRVMTSPMRPIACESELIMLMAPEVVENVLGGDGFAANAALGKGHVLRQVRGRDDGRPSACRGARQWY